MNILFATWWNYYYALLFFAFGLVIFRRRMYHLVVTFALKIVWRYKILFACYHTNFYYFNTLFISNFVVLKELLTVIYFVTHLLKKSNFFPCSFFSSIWKILRCWWSQLPLFQQKQKHHLHLKTDNLVCNMLNIYL